MSALVARRLGILFGSAAGLWFARGLLFAAQISDLDGAPLQAFVLVSGWGCVLALGVSLVWRTGRGSTHAEALWQGAIANAPVVVWAVFALAVGSYLGIVDLAGRFDAARNQPLDGTRSGPTARVAIALLALAPLAASTLGALAVWVSQSIALVRAASDRRRAAIVAFVLPWFCGGAAEVAFRFSEQRVLERCVDEPTADGCADLEDWRWIAGLHAWPRLWAATGHDASPTAPPPEEREQRARAAFEALTGFDFFAASRAHD